MYLVVSCTMNTFVHLFCSYSTNWLWFTNTHTHTQEIECKSSGSFSGRHFGAPVGGWNAINFPHIVCRCMFVFVCWVSTYPPTHITSAQCLCFSGQRNWQYPQKFQLNYRPKYAYTSLSECKSIKFECFWLDLFVINQRCKHNLHEPHQYINTPLDHVIIILLHPGLLGVTASHTSTGTHKKHV